MFPKFKEGIKMIMERKVKGKIKKASITKKTTGRFYISILVEKEYEPVRKTNKSIGIDLGLKDFLILSDGSKVKNHRFLKFYEKKLRRHQKHLSRKVKGSVRYEKQRLKVARIHEKITNSRMDMIHKITSDMIRNFDVIFLEDLNIKGMVRNHKLSKSIMDASWSKFIDVLTYKADWNDKSVIKINRYFPSSKTCNKCGHVNNSLELKDRIWRCPECGELLDRDINAAINIHNEGCKNISGGTPDHDRGVEIRPSSDGTNVEAIKKMELI